jgi:hypothetical protein
MPFWLLCRGKTYPLSLESGFDELLIFIDNVAIYFLGFHAKICGRGIPVCTVSCHRPEASVILKAQLGHRIHQTGNHLIAG